MEKPRAFVGRFSIIGILFLGGMEGREGGEKDFLFFSCDEIEGINWEKWKKREGLQVVVKSRIFFLKIVGKIKEESRGLLNFWIYFFLLFPWD